MNANSNFDTTLNNFNQANENIMLTIEIELQGSIAFPCVDLTKMNDGKMC